MPVTKKAFDQATKDGDLAALQRLSKAAIQLAAGKGDVRFVAAKNFKIGAKFTPLFLVVDRPTEFLPSIKGQGSTVVVAEGEAEVTKGDHNIHKIKITVSRGQLSANIVSTVIKLAAGNDSTYEGTTPEREKAAQDHLEAEAAQRRKQHPVAMAKDSHQQARQAGVIDYEIKFTPELVKAMAHASLHSSEFGKFNQNFTAFLKTCGMKKEGVVDQMPLKIWNELLEGLSSSGYVKKAIPKAKDGKSFIVGMEGPDGKVVREELLSEAMKGLQPFIDHAGQYMDKLIQRAASGSTYAFWSGRGADDCSRATAGITLNLGVGAFFNAIAGEYINFPKLTGVEDLPLWSVMSEMYAVKAVENIEKFRFWGFVGPTATRDQSVLNKIEIPSLIEAAHARKKAQPRVTWFVVDCEFTPDPTSGDTFKGQKGKWEWTKKESERFSTQPAAMQRLVERYER